MAKVYRHFQAPDFQLVDHGDVLELVGPDYASERQEFDVVEFTKLGWFEAAEQASDTLALTDLARDLLAEAYAGLAAPDEAGMVYRTTVSTDAGAEMYGKPIGTPITAEMEARARKLSTSPKHPGLVRAQERNLPKGAAKLGSHPDTGHDLIRHRDGRIAIMGDDGYLSPRQVALLMDFYNAGWNVDREELAKEKARLEREEAAKKASSSTSGGQRSGGRGAGASSGGSGAKARKPAGGAGKRQTRSGTRVISPRHR